MYVKYKTMANKIARKKKKKKQIQKRLKRIADLKHKVDKYKNKFNNIIIKNKENVKTDSWFDIIKYNCNNIFDKNEFVVNSYDKLVFDGYFTKKFKLILSNYDKKIINRWMNSYI